MEKIRIKIPWTNLFLESFFVVLGLTLAFVLNNWRENSSNRDHADKAVSFIMEELSVNMESIQNSMAYHRSLMDTLQVFALRGADEVPINIFKKGFIQPAVIYNTAWETAKTTNAVNHIDYEIVLAVSKIYTEQDRYNKQADMSGSVIYNEMFKSGTSGITGNYRNLLSLIRTFYYRENELLNSYQLSLEKLNKYLPAESKN